MNVLSVTALNFRSYAELDVELPLGATALVGENGAGKSSIVQAIDYALFAGRGEGARYVRRGAASMSVALQLEHRGARYLVARGVKAGKPWLAFDQLDPPSDAPLTLESVDATAELITRTLGVTRQTLRASSLLMQGDAAAWTEADPADRKRVLASVLRLEEWDRLHALAKRDRTAVAVELDQANLDLRAADELADELGPLEAQLAESEPVVAELEAELEQARANESAARARLEWALRERAARVERAAREADLRYAEAELTRAHDALEQRNLDGVRFDRAQIEGVGAEALREQLGELRAAEVVRVAVAREIREGLAAVERLEAQIADVTRRALAITEAERPACPTCGQELADAALERALETSAAQAAALTGELAGWQERLGELARRERSLALRDDVSVEELEQRASKAQAAAALAEELALRLGPVEQLEVEHRAAVRAHEAALAALAGAPEPDDAAPLEGEARRMVVDAEAETRARRAGLEGVRTARSRLEGRVSSARERLAALEGAAERRATAHRRLDCFDALLGAYSRDGVPALIVEQRAVPALEAHANAILEEWDSPMRVELRTQRATQAGAVRETLDIVILTGDGESEYAQLSGGERSRANVALRIALALLLSSSRGADVRTLVLDEVEYLDVHGTDRLAGIVRGLAAERFDRVLLVSPKADLSDALDQTIRVSKDRHGESRLELLA